MIQQQHEQRSSIVTANCLKFCYFLIFLFCLGCGNEQKKNQDLEENLSTETQETIDNGKKTILCFGDSITAGYGLDDINDAYPSVLQSKIDSLNLNYEVVNSGVSGETSSGGLSRINWVLNQDIDVFLLELGANDGLRGIPLTETKSNLSAIIQAVHNKNPQTKIIMAGRELPPNMGDDYITEFRSIFSELAEQYQLPFIPFVLQDVGGIAELNQADGIHPTVEGHKIVANNVWKVLKTQIN
ncbi:MAG: arylesterase [Bacteroidota bacterium]